jgi:hypothetical protein
MTIYRPDDRIVRRNKEEYKCIGDIDFEDGFVLSFLEGKLSRNDIRVMFKNANIPRSQDRTPKHIHWGVDLLIKKDNDHQLADKFLAAMLDRWNEISPLANRQYETVISNLKLSRNKEFLEKFRALDKHGFFKIEFITHLMELLMLQEKTNRSDAYMFKNVVNALLNSKDLYTIITKASQTRRR